MLKLAKHGLFYAAYFIALGVLLVPYAFFLMDEENIIVNLAGFVMILSYCILGTMYTVESFFTKPWPSKVNTLVSNSKNLGSTPSCSAKAKS